MKKLTGLSEEEVKDISKQMADAFDGRLLDVPVGTAVFTEKKWEALKKAEIICLDYSEDMLDKAKDRLSRCDNISF